VEKYRIYQIKIPLISTKIIFSEKKFLKNLELRKKIYIFALLNKTSKIWRRY